MDIPTVINSLFHSMDIDNIHIDRAKTICLRVSALMYKPLEQWIVIHTMDINELRILLHDLRAQNSAAITQDLEDTGYRDIPPNEIWTPTRRVCLHHVKEAKTEILRELLLDMNKEYKIPCDSEAIQNYTRAQIIIDLYHSFYKSVQVYADYLSPQEIDDLIQTPSEDFGIIDETQSVNMSMEVDSQMKAISPNTPRSRSPIKKRRVSARSPVDSNGKTIFEDIINAEETDHIVSNILRMTYDDIYTRPIDQIDALLKQYAAKYEITFPEKYFSSTRENEKRDQLFLYSLEVHTVYTPSSISANTPQSFIMTMDPMIAYSEYYLTFDEGSLTYQDVMMIKPDDVKKRLIKYCEVQCLQLSQSVDPDPDFPPPDFTSLTKDTEMFSGEIDHDDSTRVNQYYMDVLDYHRNNELSDDETDCDIISVIGLLQVADVDKLQQQALVGLIKSLYRFQGEKYTDQEILSRRQGDLRQILRDEIADLNTFNDNRTNVILHFDNVTDENLPNLGKYHLQMLLCRIHLDSDNPFSRPFGHNIESLRSEVSRLIQIRDRDRTSSPQSATSADNPPKTTNETHENMPLKAMSDEDISKLPRGESIKTLKMYSIAKGVVPPEDFLRRLDNSQLQIQLRAARDQLIHDTNPQPILDPPPPPVADQVSQPQPPPVQQHKNDITQPKLTEQATQAHNLYGVNTAVFDPSPTFQERSKVTPPKPKPDNEQADTYDVVALDREEQYLHCRVEANQEASNVHAPSFVMKLILQLRKGDPSIHILPYDLGAFSSTDILGHEKDLPEAAEELKKWIVNVSSFKTKVLFSVRISTINLSRVKTVIFAWCKRTSSFVKFVAFRSKRVFSPGWFYGISPYYYNRDHFEQYIVQQEPSLKCLITIYMKEIWTWSENKSKVSSEAIVIDGAHECRELLMKFLFEHKWCNRYRNVIFVPYKTNEIYTTHHQVSMTIRQNECLE